MAAFFSRGGPSSLSEEAVLRLEQASCEAMSLFLEEEEMQQ